MTNVDQRKTKSEFKKEYLTRSNTKCNQQSSRKGNSINFCFECLKGNINLITDLYFHDI